MNSIDKIYVINLKRRKDRVEELKEQFSKKSDINFNRDVTLFEAVDGKELVPTKELKYLTRGNDHGYKSGVVGAALSHYDLWREIMGQHHVKRVMVFEDDVELAANFTQKWNNLANQLPDDCHLLLLNPANYRAADKSKFVPVNKHFTRVFDSGYGAYSYMITPHMARRYVEYVEEHGLYRAIDGMMMDMFRVKRDWLELTDHVIDGNLAAYRLIEPITYSEPQRSSDVQNQMDSILHHRGSTKKVIKVAWINWWKEFDPHKSFFRHFIEVEFDKIVVTVDLEDEPDLVIGSIFGDYKNPPKVDSAKTKTVIFTGECHSVHNLGYDLSIGFDYEDDTKDKNYIRVPLWFFYLDWFNLRDAHLMGDPQGLPLSYLNREGATQMRDRFCLFISSNPRCSERNVIFTMINNAKKVDSAGALARNIEIPGDSRMSRFMKRNRFEMQYRFSLCCENRSQRGYCTEKLFMAFLAGSVPVYWGDPTVENDFNPKAFVNLTGLNTQEEVVSKVMEIENDLNKWIKMASTPALKEGVLENYYRKLRAQFERVIEARISPVVKSRRLVKIKSEEPAPPEEPTSTEEGTEELIDTEESAEPVEESAALAEKATVPEEHTPAELKPEPVPTPPAPEEKQTKSGKKKIA